MRRMVSPKRAIASEAQIAHRQRYRDALDWRKGLSLPNRRYLDGYCIANGVVDSYHIPLPWSRFALKLYLKHIHFVIITKPVAGAGGETEKFEAYEEGHNTEGLIYALTWWGQTFTPLVAHTINRVDLKLRKRGTPTGTCYIEIYATDGNGHPTGSPLTSVEFAPNVLLTDTLTWHSFTLPDYELLEGVKYVPILHKPGGNVSHCVAWALDTTTATYPRGNAELTQTGGSPWTSYPNYDFMFAEWGYIPGPEPVIGLLHVRHPALLTVVHKRGEATINEYENLSSLDEEYLTEQVGLDVVAGDTIEATTVAGIEAKYQVR